MTLSETLVACVLNGPAVAVALPCQVVRVKEGVTRQAKPFLDVEITDGTALERIKVWEDSPTFAAFKQLKSGDAIRIKGAFSRNGYGLNPENLEYEWLSPEERQQLFSGAPERQAELARDWNDVQAIVGAMVDPRLKLLCETYLVQYGEKFRRTAAARDFHHARRGGLLEHTSQMMRAGYALSVVYTKLNWDLIQAGILFHDCGKLWELDYQPQGFGCPMTILGELLGHITVGIELVNKLWRSLENTEAFAQPGQPGKEEVRQHLLHLIASHHGRKEYGAPVTPRTPEAWMLHHIDNVDAYQEMAQAVYREKQQLAPGIYEVRRPVEGRSVAPLKKWQPFAESTEKVQAEPGSDLNGRFDELPEELENGAAEL